ncbi:MAG: hypothetical protein EZS28_025161 [Streblomastix strix]|uniref:Uncharacterized protein n=1 Tax=Streblomastix strix TaxID=222440 RepID=A0A5J4VA18_9EUKA|nr:MAG: hypothetical protein EZS28_025161 [Streblomastix strix]
MKRKKKNIFDHPYLPNVHMLLLKLKEEQNGNETICFQTYRECDSSGEKLHSHRTYQCLETKGDLHCSFWTLNSEKLPHNHDFSIQKQLKFKKSDMKNAQDKKEFEKSICQYFADTNTALMNYDFLKKLIIQAVKVVLNHKDCIPESILTISD